MLHFVTTLAEQGVFKTGIIQNYRKMVIFWNNFQGAVLVFGLKMEIEVLRCSGWAG